MKRKLVSKTDIIIVCVLLGAAVAALFLLRSSSGEKAIANVYYANEKAGSFDLSNKTEKQILKTGADGNCVICCENGEIFFLSSDCKDKICVKSGHLSKNGDFAACLPQKVVITVSSASGDDAPDVISY